MCQTYDHALKFAKVLCENNEAELIFLTVFGSELYGTSTGASDLDIRGLFLPSLPSKLLGHARTGLHYSTGGQNVKNSAKDIDIDLWSLDHWLLNLLPAGDMGALDLLFSPSNSACVLLQSAMLDGLFRNSSKLLNLANNRTYAEYILGQAKKYGIKGSRLGALRSVWKWLETHKAEGRLQDHIATILAECGHEKYCFSLQSDRNTLVLCGKTHPGAIRMSEFRKRVIRDMEMFGARAQAAEANQGLDFKALSHAVRALNQMEELLLTGKISFPLKSRENLARIKKGEIPWNELEPLILTRLEEVNKLCDQLCGRFNFDRQFAENFYLNCYGVEKAQ